MNDDDFKYRSVTVRFFTSRYAPCMVQAVIEIPEFLDKVLEVVQANGGTDERTALLSWEDIFDADGRYNYGFKPFTHRQLDKGWDVVRQMDAWEAASLYGFNAADDLMQAGVLA